MSKQYRWRCIYAYADTPASHKSIIAYLTSTQLSASAAALREELAIGDTFDDATSKKYEGLLEKKWTSIVRLQKKVCKFSPGLENRLNVGN